jgi:hypothetical protein
VLRNVVAYGIISLGALALGREPGCGGSESPSSGVNAPCTRSKDCNQGLLCTEGVCAEPDSGVTPADAGSDSASPRDAADDGG